MNTLRATTIAMVASLLCGCTAAQIQSATMRLACSDLSHLSVGTTPEIRLLILYSEAAAAATNDIESEITLAVEEMNVALVRSGINVHAAVAHMEKVTVVDGGGEHTLLVALKAGTDGLSGAASLRVAHHADVVALIAEGVNGESFPMYVPRLKAASDAFLVAGRVPMGSVLTLAHEFGHLLGGVHQRPLPAPPDVPRYGYAFPASCVACLFETSPGNFVTEYWHTIMHTNTSGSTRIERYSNPDALFHGHALGAPNSDPAPSDMRKTFSNTASLVSFFHITPVWYASAGAAGPWFEKRVADDLMSDIALADLDGDHETDAFKVDPATFTWFISRSGSRAWEVLRTDPNKTPLGELRFADFNGDGAADVFRSDVAQQTWLVSWSGISDWQVLQGPDARIAVPTAQLAFGNFDGNNKSDVFWADETNHKWYTSANGTDAPTMLGAVDPARTQQTGQLRLVDFDGDGFSDVFWADVANTTWLWSKRGNASWEVLNGPKPEFDVAVEDLGFGDFDGDGKTDVILLGGLGWGVWWRGVGPSDLLKVSCLRLGDVRIGDFDGDGVTDVLRYGIRP